MLGNREKYRESQRAENFNKLTSEQQTAFLLFESGLNDFIERCQSKYGAYLNKRTNFRTQNPELNRRVSELIHGMKLTAKSMKDDANKFDPAKLQQLHAEMTRLEIEMQSAQAKDKPKSK